MTHGHPSSCFSSGPDTLTSEHFSAFPDLSVVPSPQRALQPRRLLESISVSSRLLPPWPNFGLSLPNQVKTGPLSKHAGTCSCTCWNTYKPPLAHSLPWCSGLCPVSPTLPTLPTGSMCWSRWVSRGQLLSICFSHFSFVYPFK